MARKASHAVVPGVEQVGGPRVLQELDTQCARERDERQRRARFADQPPIEVMVGRIDLVVGLKPSSSSVQPTIAGAAVLARKASMNSIGQMCW